MQLTLNFDNDTVKDTLPSGKPHKDISIQPDGKILYKGSIGWFSDWKLAIEYNHTKIKELNHLYK